MDGDLKVFCALGSSGLRQAFQYREHIDRTVIG